MTVLQPLPIGTSDFCALRQANQIYVDKTEFIHQLACLLQKFFLTRPRRFGKSLLDSTFASLFRDGLKDFSGLAIEKLWKDSFLSEDTAPAGLARSSLKGLFECSNGSCNGEN